MMTDPLDSDPQPEDGGSTPASPQPAGNEPPADAGFANQAPENPQSHPSGLFFPAVGQGKMTVEDEKRWAMIAHLSSLAGIVTLSIGYVVGPLIVYLMKKGESPYLDEHTKETLNFSIITAIAIWVSSLGAVASAPILGCFAPLIPVVFAVLNLVFCIQGSLAAKNGEAYRYKWNWRMIK